MSVVIRLGNVVIDNTDRSSIFANRQATPLPPTSRSFGPGIGALGFRYNKRLQCVIQKKTADAATVTLN